MSGHRLNAAVQRMRDAIDAVFAPAFVLSVAPSGTLLLAGANARFHTGMGTGGGPRVVSQTLDAALPAPMAETLRAQARACVAANRALTYEENAFGAAPLQSMQVTLSPIYAERKAPRGTRALMARMRARSAKGRAATAQPDPTTCRETAPSRQDIVGVMGVAAELPAQHPAMGRHATHDALTHRKGEDLWLEATRTAERLRGPLALIATLARADLRASAQRPDGSGASAGQLILGTAEDALKDVDAIGARIDRTVTFSEAETVNVDDLVAGALGRMGSRAPFAVRSPRLHLRTDADLAERVLHRCFELAALDNARMLRLSLAPLALDTRRLRLCVSFDAGRTRADRRGRLQALRGLENLLASFGGTLDITWSPAAGETTLDLSIPGRLETSVPAVLRRTRPEGLTAPTPFGRASSAPGADFALGDHPAVPAAPADARTSALKHSA